MQSNKIPLLERLLRLCEVCDVSGLGKTTVYKKISLGQFPRQVPIGSPNAKRGTSRWALSAVNEWIDARKMGESWQSKNSQPETLKFQDCAVSCKSTGSRNTTAAKELI